MKKINIILILLLVIFLLVRFWNFEKRVGFDWDHENYMTDVYNLVVNHKPTLIGPRVNNDRGFFLGPQFTYIASPLFLITGGNVVNFFWVFLILINITFFRFSFFVAEKSFNKSAGIFFLIFWSTNLVLINYDTNPWWPIFIPLGAVSSWFFLNRIFESNKLRDWIYLGLLNGIFMNMHFQYIFIICFNWIFLTIFLWRNKKISVLNILGYFIPFVSMFVPLFLFDLRHDYLNSKQFADFFLVNDSGISVYRLAWVDVFGNFIQPIIFVKNQYITYIFYLLILLLIIYLIKKTTKFQTIFFQATLALWIIFPIFFYVYGKRPSEYYFVFLYPFIYLLISFYLSQVIRYGKKIFALLMLFPLSFLALNISFFSDNPLGLYYKNLSVARIKQLSGNKPVRVNLNTEFGRNVGFNYLIKYHKINTSEKPGVPSFEITVPPKNHNERFGGIGLQIPKL